MYSSGSALLLITLLVGLSCETAELDFQPSEHASGDLTAPDPAEGGSYDGEPIVFKEGLPKDGNAYVQYMSLPLRTWEADVLREVSFKHSPGNENSAPTIISDQSIARQLETVSVGTISQVAAPRSATLTARQRGIVAKSSLGASQANDEFLSNNRGLLDILLVMDNSGSMRYESTYIMRYLPELMKHIWRSDWRLGVVTSSPNDACSITTASVKDAATANKLDLTLDRSSTNYRSFHTDLSYSTPRYLDPYFHYEDYRWLSYCQYSNVGYCRYSCGRSDESCIENQYDHYSGRDYHEVGSDGRHEYNPLWGYFKTPVALPDKSIIDSVGTERLLRKARWALEGKPSTGCRGEWARDNATVIAIIVTDEEHNCDDEDASYCSIQAYKDFVSSYRNSHPFKTYAVLGSKLLADQQTRSPNWNSEELKAFDGYVVNHLSKFEGGHTLGYFSGLPQGFTSATSLVRVGSSSKSYYGKLRSNYGHRSLHLISMAISEEMRNIYSPLSFTPDTGSVVVKVGEYTLDKNTQVADYNYTDVSACRAGDTSGGCFKVVNGAHGSAIELVNYKNMTHFDQKVMVTYNYGGTQTSAVQFDTSWQLNFAPNPTTVEVTVTNADNKITTLTASDYTISGEMLSVEASRVQELVPEGSSISIDYTSPVELSNLFTLDSRHQLPSGADIKSGTVQITVSDVHGNDMPGKNPLTSGFNFNGHQVSFDAVLAAGESFTMSYQYWGNKITTYAYSRNTNTDSNVPLRCMNSNSIVNCAYDATNQQVTFTNSNQFNANDRIAITETLQRTGTGVTISDIDMSNYNYAEDEEISIALGQDTCSTDRNGPNLLTVSNEKIRLDGVSGADCVIINSLNSNAIQEITVRYQAYNDLPDDFLQMDKNFFAKHKGKYKFEYWAVTVDGQPKTDFMIEDYKITEIDTVQTEDEVGMRNAFGNDTRITVKVRLYHAL